MSLFGHNVNRQRDSCRFGVRPQRGVRPGLAQRWKRPALPFEAKEALSAARGNTYPATNVVDINRARAKAAAPIVKTSNIAELNQTLAGSSPNPWAQPPGW